MHFVLLIEDDAGRVEWFRKHSLPGMRIVHARSAGLALGMLRRDKYHGILLDNDLEKAPITFEDTKLAGSDLIPTIILTQNRGVPVLIHSMNREWPALMGRQLESCGFDVTRCRFSELTDEIFQEWLGDIMERS